MCRQGRCAQRFAGYSAALSMDTSASRDRNGDITFLTASDGWPLSPDAERLRKRFAVVWEISDGLDAGTWRPVADRGSQRLNGPCVAFSHDLDAPVRAVQDPPGEVVTAGRFAHEPTEPDALHEPCREHVQSGHFSGSPPWSSRDQPWCPTKGTKRTGATSRTVTSPPFRSAMTSFC